MTVIVGRRTGRYRYKNSRNDLEEKRNTCKIYCNKHVKTEQERNESRGCHGTAQHITCVRVRILDRHTS